MTDSVKINFKLKSDEGDYPPASVESLWAQPMEGDYVIDGIPFFTSDATNGDRVSAWSDDNGRLWFKTVIQKSSNSLIRVVFFDLSVRDEITDHLKTIGCGTEHMREFKLLAIDVPLLVPLLAVQTYLQSKEASKQIDYEEPILRQ